jgi:hypothetical protein
VYYNRYDLGFGRDMHMQKGGQDGSCGNCIAYYVTNYDNADLALDQKKGAIATVAMEYGPLTDPNTPFSRFYVFDKDGAISTTAALDESGPKYVPTLCIICHNGNIGSMDPTTGNLHIARFIPFDLESFDYPTDPQWSRDKQAPKFKEMNRAVLNNTNPSLAEQRLITHWYGSVGDTSLPGDFNPDAVPSEWTVGPNDKTLYNVVVKPSCRSCHSTRDEGGTPHLVAKDITWGSYDSFNANGLRVRFQVCGQMTPGAYNNMPHAERTYARFWLSTQPNAPRTLATSDLDAFQPKPAKPEPNRLK